MKRSIRVLVVLAVLLGAVFIGQGAMTGACQGAAGGITPCDK